MLRLRQAAALAVLTAPTAAGAVTVDFEAQGANAPAFIQPSTRSQTLNLSGATFSGGVVIVGTDDYLDDAGDFTAAYTTAPYTSFTNPLSISFASAVSSVSLAVVNNIAGTYQISVNGGAAQNYLLSDYAERTISLTGTAISRVTIGYQTSTNPNPFAPSFDFAIDDVTFQPAMAAAVPEMSTWAMLLVGFGVVAVALRRQRVNPRMVRG